MSTSSSTEATISVSSLIARAREQVTLEELRESLEVVMRIAIDKLQEFVSKLDSARDVARSLGASTMSELSEMYEKVKTAPVTEMPIVAASITMQKGKDCLTSLVEYARSDETLRSIYEATLKAGE